ncbi:MAG: hypothetical protein LUD81_01135 [Clostridiales bacterium]|nr:hypothetical protein [Clostridiales bacterium]
MKKEGSLLKTAVIGVIAAAVVFAAVVLVIVFSKGSGSSDVVPLTKYTVTEDRDENTSAGETVNKYLIFTDENGESITLTGSDYMSNLAQDRFIVVNGGRLSYFADGEEKSLTMSATSCSISNDGSLVAFVTPNSNEKKYVGTLFTYDTVKGETHMICQDVFVSTSSTIQISPSGNVIAYVRNYDEEEYTYDCCYYMNEKEYVIGQNIDVLAISDDAEYIYYVIEDPDSYSNVFAVYTKSRGEVILDEEFYNNFYLNLDYSECVYYKARNEEPLYITRKGSEGELYLEKADDFDTSSLIPHVNSVINVESFE